MIIVTGASGQLGRAIVQHLVTLMPAGEVVATCRDPAKAADLGVQVRQADFADPASLATAFSGAAQVLIVSSNARATGGDTVAQHRAAIAAAAQAGAQRILYTSHMAASATSAFAPMHDHAATEAMLATCGLPWTALRHGFYAASGVAMLQGAVESGLLETAGDGPFSWVAHDDLAQAAALILTEKVWTQGPTAPLTGPQALRFADLAALAADITGRPIRHDTLPDAAMRAKILARGAPEQVADRVLGLYIAARQGEFAAMDPALATLLGRPLMQMHDLITAAYGAFVKP